MARRYISFVERIVKIFVGNIAIIKVNKFYVMIQLYLFFLVCGEL